LASTVSYVLGMKPPRHCQGRILFDFFEGWDVTDMRREWRPLKFPKKEPLVGDVTDTQIKKA